MGIYVLIPLYFPAIYLYYSFHKILTVLIIDRIDILYVHLHEHVHETFK